MSDRLDEFLDKLDEAAEAIAIDLSRQYDQKNLAYGNNAHQGFLKYGPISYIIRIEDKLNRLETLWSNPSISKDDESIMDTLGDAISYCFMFIGSMAAEDDNGSKYTNEEYTHQCFVRNTDHSFVNYYIQAIRDYENEDLFYDKCFFDVAYYDEELIIEAVNLIKTQNPHQYSEPIFVLAYRLLFLLALFRVDETMAKRLCDKFFVRPKGYESRFDYWKKNHEKKENV